MSTSCIKQQNQIENVPTFQKQGYHCNFKCFSLHFQRCTVILYQEISKRITKITFKPIVLHNVAGNVSYDIPQSN